MNYVFMKITSILLLIVLSINVIKAQHTIMLKEGKLVEGKFATMPFRDIEETIDGITVTYELNNVAKFDDSIYPSASFLKIEGFGTNCTSGEPSTLMRWDFFAIPDGMLFDVCVIDSSFIDVPMELSPSRPLLFDDNIHKDVDILPINAYTGFFPKNIISSTHVSDYCGTVVFEVCFNPIKYDYENKIVRVYTHVTYKVNYLGKEFVPNNSRKTSQKDLYDSFLDNTTLNARISNHGILDKGIQISGHPYTPNYYIFTTTKFEESITKFVEWKKILGFNVKIFSEVNWTVNQLKDTIQHYNNADSYLLIIGDHEDVPSEFSTFHFQNDTDSVNYYSDYNYMYKSGNSTIPYAYCGRLPVSSKEEAETVLNKIINYERYPVMDSSFYNTGLNCAFFCDESPCDGYEDRRFVLTSERIRNYMLGMGKSVNRVYTKSQSSIPTYWNNTFYAYGDEIPDSLKVNNFYWNGNSENISENINNGAFFILYRGHGQSFGWQNPPYSINTLDVFSLNNTIKHPLLLSITCNTGNFCSPSVCLVEKLLRSDKGCIAAFAATAESDTGCNDALAEAIFDTLWPSPGLVPSFPGKNVSNYPTYIPEFRLGKLLSQAMTKARATWLYEMPNVFLYHCFGDPSMRIYTEQPSQIDNVTIIRTPGHVSVSFDPKIRN